MLGQSKKGMLYSVTGSVVLLLIVLSAAVSVINNKTTTLTEERYTREADELQKRMQLLIDAKSDAVRFIALSVSNDGRLIDALRHDDHTKIALDGFARRLAVLTRFKHIWFQVLTTEGDSFYRSWTDKRGDSLLETRAEIAEMIFDPKIISTISPGKFDLTFKAMVPIYDGGEFIGIFEVMAKFNSIAEQLEADGVFPLFLVDSAYKEQFLYPYTKRFMGRYYIANMNADPELVAYVQSNNLMAKSGEKYYVDESARRFVTFYKLFDANDYPMAHLFLFKPLDTIDLGPVVIERNRILLYIIGSYLLLLMGGFFYVSRRRARRVEEFNTVLERSVREKTAQIEHQRNFLQAVIDGVSDSVMVIGRDYAVTLMNQTAKLLYKTKSVGDLHGPKCYEISHNQTLVCSAEEHPCPLGNAIELRRTSKVVHKHFDALGEPYYVELTATPLFDEKGEVEAVIEVSHDITAHLQIQNELREQKNALNYMAHFDALTKLPNRVLFLDRVERAIEHCKRNEKKLALLFIDLDRFKEINDSFGHSTGDKVLVQNAMRLQKAIRKSDTLSRLSGDEFSILLDEIDSNNVVIDITEKLVQIFKVPLLIEGKEFFTTASIGIATYPDDGDDTESLLQHADAAMYKAKEGGRNSYRFYTQEMTSQAFERIVMEGNLRHAIMHREFVVHYQPQYDSRSEEIIGFEALVRWQHPELGLVPPDRFIPIAEETGLIIGIGEQVLEEAMRQVSAWNAAGLKPGKMAINLSVKQLQHSGLLEHIMALLKRCAASPTWIELEITEGSILHDVGYASEVLSKLRAHGIEIAIDDFGTGYSSLAYLKQLPIGKLKIDRSFVRDIPEDHDDMAITMAIISMAQSLHLSIIAEGVETEAQKRFLLDNGCAFVQGYYYSKPLPAEAAEALLRARMQNI